MTADKRPEASRAFLAAAALLGLAIVAGLLWVASHEWFFADDFVFLHRAQLPQSLGDWLQTFVPTRPRRWWSYRPLTIEVYYALLTRAVGLVPFPYLAVNVAAHCLAALVLGRIARQLGYGIHAAVACVLLALAAYASANEIFWAATFQHVGARLFYLITISTFLEWQRSGTRRWLIASCLVMLLTLTSNEIGVTLPGPLLLLALALGDGSAARRLSSAVRSVAPHLGIMASFVWFRWFYMPPAMIKPSFAYIATVGPHIITNVGSYLAMFAHYGIAHGAALAALIALTWRAVRRSGHREVGRQLASRSGICLGWALLVMLPFLGWIQAQPRIGMSLEAPLCLLVAAHFDAISRLVPARRMRVFEVALLVFIALSIPLRTLRDRARWPRGGVNRDLAAILSTRPPLGRLGCVILRRQDEPQWTWSDRFEAKFRTNGILAALQPRTVPRLYIGVEPKLQRPCIELEIRRRPGLTFEIREPDPAPSSRAPS